MSYDLLHYFPTQLTKPKSDFAVFIDRDGVIWGEKDPGVPFQAYTLYPRAAPAIKKLNDRGIYTVVVTNQARVARGQITEKEARQSNLDLAEKLKVGGAKIDLMLYCPHSKFADVEEYRIDCDWRKPGSGMLDFVHQKFGIDLSKSYLIGDQARDFLAAQKAGVKSIGVRTGKAGGDEVFNGEPDIWRRDLQEAVNYILKIVAANY